MESSPKFATSQLPDVDYAGFARSLDLGGRRIDSADAVALGRGLPRRPFVMDAVVDADVPSRRRGR